jgi:hypothetical protein
MCHFLVADFDGSAAMLDALAYGKAARAGGVPVAVEISQSGRGAHVWVFFAGAVTATVALHFCTGAHEQKAKNIEARWALLCAVLPSRRYTESSNPTRVS